MNLNTKSKGKQKRREFIKTSAAVGAAVIVPAVFGVFSGCKDKTDLYYNTLADALNKLPNAFPRTKSNIEIQLLKKIFSPEEAWLCGQLTIRFESVDKIAERIGLSVRDTQSRLEKMSKRGFIWGNPVGGQIRLAPFIVGIYEEQLWNMDHELAHLMEEYMVEGGAEFMRPQPAIHRVVPAQSSTKSEWILPYDDIKAILKTKKSFHVIDCICRVQQDLIGERKCDFPVHVCLSFTSFERPPSEGSVSLQEALDIIDKTEEIGLVHSVSNIAEGFFYVCNCCGCCCGILRGITDYGIENSVAASNYYAVDNPEKCRRCGTCIRRCQMKAISDYDGPSVVDRKKCIGCGLCVTGCEFGVMKLERKPDNEIITPPKDFAVWENERLKNRGIQNEDI